MFQLRQTYELWKLNHFLEKVPEKGGKYTQQKNDLKSVPKIMECVGKKGRNKK